MSGWTIVSDQSTPAGAWVMSDVKGVETGSGSGLNSLGEAFASDKVQFAVIRVLGVDEQSSPASRHSKLVRINWVGSKVPPMKKMGSLQGKQLIAELWNGCAVEIDSSNAKDLSMNRVALELVRCSGAYKPARYEFGDGFISLSEVRDA